MRAYKLPTDEWIDLDHVQAISHMWNNCSGSFHYHLCNLTLAFQNKTKEITLASFSDWNVVGEKRDELWERKQKIAQSNYEKLLTAWKEV